jgi:hypothetical protein
MVAWCSLLAATAMAQMSLDERGYFRNGTKLFFPVGVNYVSGQYERHIDFITLTMSLQL